MSHSVLVSILAFSFLTACASQPENAEANEIPVSNVSAPTETTVAMNDSAQSVSEASASSHESTVEKSTKKKKSPKKKKKPGKAKHRV